MSDIFGLGSSPALVLAAGLTRDRRRLRLQWAKVKSKVDAKGRGHVLTGGTDHMNGGKLTHAHKRCSAAEAAQPTCS